MHLGPVDVVSNPSKSLAALWYHVLRPWWHSSFKASCSKLSAEAKEVQQHCRVGGWVLLWIYGSTDVRGEAWHSGWQGGISGGGLGDDLVGTGRVPHLMHGMPEKQVLICDWIFHLKDSYHSSILSLVASLFSCLLAVVVVRNEVEAFPNLFVTWILSRVWHLPRVTKVSRIRRISWCIVSIQCLYFGNLSFRTL